MKGKSFMKILVNRRLTTVVILTVLTVACTFCVITYGQAAGVPTVVKVHSGNSQTGPLNNPLDSLLTVRVLDAARMPIEGATVMFQATNGSGEFSSEMAVTDMRGYAQTAFTPTVIGLTRIIASVSGTNDIAIFRITGQEIGTLNTNRVEAEDLPMMYWIDGGTLYRLGDPAAVAIAEGVTSIAVGGGKLYWISENHSTVNRANLDGTEMEELRALLSIPMGMTFDAATNKLYWTNERGRILRSNPRTSSIQELSSDGRIIELMDAGDIAVDSGYVYWTEGGTVIKRANLTGTATVVEKVVTSMDDISGIAAGGGKLYWTAAMGIHAANADGTEAMELRMLSSTPMDIAVDTMNNRLYWTTSSGQIQSSGLNARFITNVVTSLVSPTTLVVSASEAPAGAARTAPTALATQQREVIQAEIDLLLATNDGSPETLQRLAYLQELLVSTRPEQTLLLANYPNPFNPETWIPYQLAADTAVKVTIYNTQGIVVRTLQLGHQAAGYYTDRDRAAYWDGRNAMGEPVSSGIYFYQLETNEMSSLRKMVILK